MRSFIILCVVALVPATAQAHDIGHFHIHGIEITVYHACIVAGIIGYVLHFFGKGDK